jgi:hypothetical protein
MSKFEPGNNANPKGRPKTAYKEDFDQLMAKKKMFDRGCQIANDKWEDIIEAMATQAIRGNVQAAVFIRDTFIGKPKDTIIHDTTEDVKHGLRLAYSIKNDQ